MGHVLAVDRRNPSTAIPTDSWTSSNQTALNHEQWVVSRSQFQKIEERAQAHIVDRIPFWRMIIFPNSPPFLYGQLCFRPSDCDIGVRKAGAWLAPPSSLNPLIINHWGNSKNDSHLKISTRVYKKKHRNNSSPAHFYSSLSLCFFSVQECCS